MRKYTIKNPNEPASSAQITLAKSFLGLEAKRTLNDKFMVV